MDNSTPGIVVAALRGGSGKTIFSVGIIAALREKGFRVAPFKKGPDYIDAGWLALAAGRPCYNLDTFLIDSDTIQQSYRTHTADADIAVIEGNRGLYDCIDTSGETATAELAKLLDIPLILCIDGTKTTRTMAAVVSGCANFDPALKLKGVVLNRVAGPRHERILRDSIEYYCGIPILGALPKQRKQRFPERHMGLVPTHEHEWAQEAVAFIQGLAEKYIDLDAVNEVAAGTYQWQPEERRPQVCADIRFKSPEPEETTVQAALAERAIKASALAGTEKAPPADPAMPRIGVLRDSAFQFYYPENLEALETAGAHLVFTSPLTDAGLPEVDALYIGGGFPETHAEQLAANSTYAQRIKDLAEQGLPIYAECGGLMYLGEKLILDSGDYEMAGVLPIVFGFSKKPQGHGYTIIKVDRDNPYFEAGTLIRGHEFHYSTVEQWQGSEDDMVYAMERGNGIVKSRDGLCRNNVLATYTHIHALGTPQWAPALVGQARRFKEKKHL
ncbi:MAG: cobyrinate a,c-diamide synthase [Desulfobacteraceae bacterium]